MTSIYASIRLKHRRTGQGSSPSATRPPHHFSIAPVAHAQLSSASPQEQHHQHDDRDQDDRSNTDIHGSHLLNVVWAKSSYEAWRRGGFRRRCSPFVSARIGSLGLSPRDGSFLPRLLPALIAHGGPWLEFASHWWWTPKTLVRRGRGCQSQESCSMVCRSPETSLRLSGRRVTGSLACGAADIHPGSVPPPAGVLSTRACPMDRGLRVR